MTPGCFFILGNPRSGTSLLRNVLNAHPGISVPPECGFLLWLKDRFSGVVWNPGTRERFLEEVLAAKKFETWEMDRGFLRDVLMNGSISGYADAASCVYEAYAAAKGKRISHWGDKNNYYVRHVPELLELLPQSNIIHIVRDPRDVVCSYLELGGKEIASKYVPALPRDAAEAAAEWQHNTERVRAACTAAGNEPFTVRYEDLVMSFEPTIAEVFAFLGVPMPAGFNDRSHLGSLDEPVEFLQWKAKVTGPVDTASVGRFRKELSPGDLRAVEQTAREGMGVFGYAPAAIA